MPIDGLNHQQGVAFIAETNSAKNLLAYGVRVIRTGAFSETTYDPILTMLSIGFEKLHKLALGLIHLDRDGEWPSDETKGYGHKLSIMHEKLYPLLESRAAGKSHVQDLLAKAKADPVTAPLIAALDQYGQGGRFSYLDLIGDAPRKWDDPRTCWDRIEQAARSDPAISSAAAAALAASSDDELWGTFTRMVGDRIATTVEQIWTAIAECGRHGVLGDDGRPFGSEVHPNAVGSQVRT